MKKISILPSKIHGKGIFADEFIGKGEKIQYINGSKELKRTSSPIESVEIAHWIGMSKYTWINTSNTPFRYINHSCEPNAAIIGRKTLIALKDIKAGEEIFIDYSMTDADPHWSIECTCGSKQCRGHIGPITSLPPSVFKRHMPHIPKNFQRIYIKNYIKTNSKK